MRLTPYDQVRTNQLWRIHRAIDRLIDSAASEASPDAERLNQLARRKLRLEGRITEIWLRSVTDSAAVEPAGGVDDKAFSGTSTVLLGPGPLGGRVSIAMGPAHRQFAIDGLQIR